MKEKSRIKQNNLFKLRVKQGAEKIKYKNSLIVESENSIIFSIDPNLLGSELRNNLFKFLNPIFKKREKFITEIFKNQQEIKEKMKCTYSKI